ncbi:MAG: HlyC/CorC family transporter [Pseudomonadota bacterium]
MTADMILIMISIVVLLSISAFFSGSETAMTAASRARVRSLEKEGDTRATTVAALASEPERMIGAILIGNNLVNILASALATTLFLSIFGEAGVVYATLAMTALVVVFAEVLPKTYAIFAPERMALAVSPVLRVIVVVLAPIADGVQFIVRRVLGSRLTASQDDATTAAQEELRGTIDLHHQDGAVVKHDRDMLGGILDLGDLEVVDVMVHRTQMQTIDAGDTGPKILDEVLRSPHTRLPMYRDEPENIVGILHVKDVLRELNRQDHDVEQIDFQSFASDPWFVPESTGLKEQLDAFLRRKSHFALVVDEYGEVMGLVTLEDILEEIVGQITDEHDIEYVGIRPQPTGSVNVDGSVPVRDLNRHMDWTLPEDEATTIAGLVIHEAQTIPEPGQVFTFYRFRIEVLRKQRNQITALRITPIEPEETGDQTEQSASAAPPATTTQ